MKKRILIIAFTVVFAVVSLCVFSSALSYNDIGIDLDESVGFEYTYSTSFDSSGYHVTNCIAAPDSSDYFFSLSCEYNGVDSVTIYFDSSLYSVFIDDVEYSGSSFTFDTENNSVYITFNVNNLNLTNYTLFTFSPVENTDIFDISSLIGIVGSFVTFVINSPVLLALLLIGVTCSVGFVAVKVIRKVMWGN